MDSISTDASSEANPPPSWVPVLLTLGVLAATVLAVSLVDGPVSVILPVAGLGFALAVLRLFTSPIRLLAGFLLVVVNLDFFKVGSGGLTLDVIASSLLLGLLLVWVLVSHRHTVSASPLLERWFVVFLAAMAVSVVLSPLPGISLKRFGRELEYLAVVLLVLRQPLRRDDIRILLGAVICSAVVPSVLGILGYVFHIPSMLGQELFLANAFEAEARVRSTLSHPNTLALYLTVALSLTGALWLSGRLFSRWFTGPMLLLQLVTMYLTYGRTGWMGAFIACIALLWLRGQRKLLWVGLPFVILAAWRIVPNFQERLATAQGTESSASFIWRLGLWDFALHKFPERPIFGSGIGTFLEYVDYLEGYGPHQTWIGLLVETGVVGVLAFLGLMVATGSALARAKRTADPETLPLVQGVIAAWIGVLAGSLVGNAFGLPPVMIYLWTLIAVAVSRAHVVPEAPVPESGRQI